MNDDWAALASGTEVDFRPGDRGRSTRSHRPQLPSARFTNAINAVAANGTVDVLAGTYKENLTVGKSIKLLGANAGIAGASSRAESIILTNGNQNAVVSLTTSGATIDGFTIDGDDPTVTGAASPAATIPMSTMAFVPSASPLQRDDQEQHR